MKLTHIAAGITAALSVTIMLSSCSNVPEHAQFIPKDAVAVTGINTRELSKKIAWNAILGSKILDQIKQQQPRDAATQLDKAGIEYMSTSYVYLHKTVKNAQRITALVPLSDAAKWEAYMQQVFPHAATKQVKDRKEALLADNMYVGWNKKLLVVMSILPKNGATQTPNMSDLEAPDSGDDTDSVVTTGSTADSMIRATAKQVSLPEHADPADYEQEMALAFSVTKENALTSDQRFTNLEKEGHDISVWINQEEIVRQSGMSGLGGMNIMGTLMKNVALAGGFDFEKGRIAGQLKYYPTEAYVDAWKEMGGDNIDREMLERMPAQNLNVLAGWHLAPKGIKAVLDKSGISGLLGFGLMAQGLTMDDILDAFTGDMAYAMNDFSMSNNAVPDSTHLAYTPNLKMNYLYALKINKKEAFQKLLLLAQNQHILYNNGNNTYRLGEDMGSALTSVIAVNDQYVVIANTLESAQAFIQGKYKGQKMPEDVRKEIFGHPIGAYADIHTIVNAASLPAGMSDHDSAVATEAKKLVSNMTLAGGEFKNLAFAFHSQVNLTDQSENSLLQLLGFLVKVENHNGSGQPVAVQQANH
ncbi:DUF4836 family protein [Chitinophagaceae bacterium MMS25-I14]